MKNKIIKSKNKISLKISSFNKNFIYFFAFKLKKKIKFYGFFRLPNKKKLYTLIRSPFVNKKSRLQFGFNLHTWKFFIEYYDPYPEHWKNVFSFNKFLINNFKKIITSKYSVKLKICRESFFFS